MFKANKSDFLKIIYQWLFLNRPLACCIKISNSLEKSSRKVFLASAYPWHHCYFSLCLRKRAAKHICLHHQHYPDLIATPLYIQGNRLQSAFVPIVCTVSLVQSVELRSWILFLFLNHKFLCYYFLPQKNYTGSLANNFGNFKMLIYKRNIKQGEERSGE